MEKYSLSDNTWTYGRSHEIIKRNVIQSIGKLLKYTESYPNPNLKRFPPVNYRCTFDSTTYRCDYRMNCVPPIFFQIVDKINELGITESDIAEYLNHSHRCAGEVTFVKDSNGSIIRIVYDSHVRDDE